MKKLTIKALRDFRQLAWRMLLVIVVLACGIAVFVGGLGSRETLENTRSTLYRELNMADLTISFDPVKESKLPSFRDFPNVKSVQFRRVESAYLEKDGRLITAMLVLLGAEHLPTVNSLKVENGTYLRYYDMKRAVLERSTALYYGIKVGDKIAVRWGGKPYEFNVGGIALNPEFLITTTNPDLLFPSPGSLAVIYLSDRILYRTSKVHVYNQALFRYVNPDEAESTQAAVLSHMRGIKLTKVVPLKNQFANRYLNENFQRFNIFIPVVVFVFALVSFMVVFMTMDKLIMSQRREVGAFLAMGYGKLQILRSFLINALVIGLLGSVLGIAASFEINSFFAASYAKAIGFPQGLPVVDSRLILWGIVFGIFLPIAAALYPVLRLVSLAPVEAIRGGQVETFSRTFVALLDRITELPTLSAPLKYAMRTLFRRIRATAGNVFVIALGVGMATSFIIALRSVAVTSEKFFGQEKWDAMVDFDDPQGYGTVSDWIKTLPEISEWEPIAKGYSEVRRSSREGNFNIIGVPFQSKLKEMKLTAGRPFSSNDALEAVFNQSLRSLGKVELGDTLEVQSSEGTVKLAVVGLTSRISSGEIYVPRGTAEKILGLGGKVTSVMIKSAMPADKLEQTLLSEPFVERVVFKREMEKSVTESISQITNVVYLAIALGTAIAVLVMVNSITINVMDQEREFVILSSLGHKNFFLLRIVFAQALVMGVTAMALCIPISIALAYIVNWQASRAWFNVSTTLVWTDFLKVTLPALLCIPLATIPGLFYIGRLRIADVIRKTNIE
ncbi:MAG: FtsX-like permease family protein [Candidatus Omnitrophica bacterium]|nr:FtsX-like permease family protein [Candidatus Omnitrophota bacterium]